MKTGNLYLIPNVIADNTQSDVIASRVKVELANISHFLAEDIRTARRYLKSLNVYETVEPLHFQRFNKDTTRSELKGLLIPIFEGLHLGIISDSGCPGIADPGAIAVKFAHENNISVIPLVGPSSIILALMASGLNGQRFAFHGYLPINVKESSNAIRDLERESRQKNQTQLFIETPYRSNTLFQTMVGTLNDTTLLSIAVDLTSAAEDIKTHTIASWKVLKKELPKLPAVFSFLAI
ncbi:MAG TPA: SAM-dependent methyltransferase [Chryseolinea sp.]|nr:SAM-dependent methyltransferase [Chryseolinea sp.]